VITQPDRPAGRGQRERPSPVKELASQFGLPILQPQDVNSAESLAAIGEVDPDAIVVAAFGQKLGEAILKMPPHGCINVHASLLPRWRGAAPIQRAIMAGDQTTGVTIMLMDEGWDTGDIICQREVPIEADETGGSLHDKLAEEGAKLLLEALADLAAGKVVPQPQDHQKAVMAPKLTKEEQVIDWLAPAPLIERLVRALAPWPGARTYHRGRLLKICASALHPCPKVRPGEVYSVQDEGFVVGCGEGGLLITRVQPANKGPMSGRDYINGYQLQVGEVLGREGS
jgi:methionyl-tRNA formyltransferase